MQTPLYAMLQMQAKVFATNTVIPTMAAAAPGSQLQDHADASCMSFGSKRMAPLADGAATVSSGGTTLLATVVCEQPQQPLWKQRIHQSFLEVGSSIPKDRPDMFTWHGTRSPCVHLQK